MFSIDYIKEWSESYRLSKVYLMPAKLGMRPSTASKNATIERYAPLKAGITYISSHAKQENLYAVYETTERKFWKELAKCNQEEFVKSGTEGKCIEARELIIALPESFTEYQPDRLLQLFTNSS